VVRGLLSLACLATLYRIQDCVGHQGNYTTELLQWRTARNDGLNCLYLQLRLLGYEEPFEVYLREALRRKVPGDLKSLASFAEQLGFKLQPARLTMRELERMKSPVTVHLEREHPAGGYFVLVQQLAKHHVVVVDGPSATFRVFSRDLFRRQWTTYALVPEAALVDAALIRRAIAVFMALWATFLVSTRLSIDR